mgnify:CR=1 FL=1
MVKGVSKTIIEVNNTGSRFFEKIVFYVTPEYGNLNAKHLKRAAADFAFKYNDSLYKKPLRKFHKRRQIINVCLLGLGLLSLVAVGVILIL